LAEKVWACPSLSAKAWSFGETSPLIPATENMAAVNISPAMRFLLFMGLPK
jgi:hypothetical protein